MFARPGKLHNYSKRANRLQGYRPHLTHFQSVYRSTMQPHLHLRGGRVHDQHQNVYEYSANSIEVYCVKMTSLGIIVIFDDRVQADSWV